MKKHWLQRKRRFASAESGGGGIPRSLYPILRGHLAISVTGSKRCAGGKRLVAAEGPLRLYRALAEAYPDAYLPDLSLALNNLGTVLRDLGRREEALKAAEEAVGHYRALSEARPDAFISDLARSPRRYIR